VNSELRIRRAARALVLADRSHVLLVRFEFPGDSAAQTVWALPGGGLEHGEDHLRALRRELAEELGLVDPPIGRHIWTRRHVVPFPDGNWDGQEEHIHLVEVAEPFEPRPQQSWDQLHQEYVAELRWWSTRELGDAPAGTVFAPRRLPHLLATLLTEGPPPTSIHVGV
jgi:8-oxo-dGTP pyrophosphatase MutT (NUDIX family)